MSDKEVSEKLKEKRKTISVNGYTCCSNFPNIVGATVFITAGIVLLLNNFNVISWSIWNYLAVFWPIVFVFIGLDIISGNSWVSKIITTIIGLLIITFVLIFSLTAVDSRFRNIMFNNFPLWKTIYQGIPKIESPNFGVKSGKEFEDYRFNDTDYFLN